jgi:CubicO group peptidase (beta-lactamase class C family)
MQRLLNYFRKVFGSEKVPEEVYTHNSLEQVDFFLHQLINQERIPGLAITVLKKGDVLFQKGYGYADLAKKTPVYPEKTLFRSASASKPIAATALAKMVSEGTIDLDASFYQYVPYFPKKGFDFTIRQLASHTAGIRGYKGKEYALNKPLTIKGSIDIFKNDPLLFAPGSGYHYNSFDWVLVSLAMQEASGISFTDYVEKEVLKPLRMKNTLPEEPEITFPNQATFYTKQRSGFKIATTVDNRFKLAGGGYLSTSSDLAKLGQAYLDQKILPTKVQQEFLTSMYINGQPTYYGLGWQVSEDRFRRPYYGHVGNGVGGYSNFFVYPEHELVFAMLINSTDPKIQEVLDANFYPLFFEIIK